MRSLLRHRLHGRSRPVAAFAAGIAALHLAAGAALLIARPHWPLVLGFAGLAYALGVRHAFDADHIVAIDGTTRQLLARGRSAAGVGFWFSLGHSTVVTALSLWVAHEARTGAHGLGVLRPLGGLLGLATSSAFMLVVAAVNLGIFRDTLAAVRRADEAGMVAARTPFGLGARVSRRVLGTVRRPTDMYAVGFLFGLGLDTASEIALLAISATAAARALPTYAVVVLPLAFASGMSLADSIEGALIAQAYGWAQGVALRRARYNLVVTGFTVLAAVIVSALELSEFGGIGAPSRQAAIGLGVAAVLLGAWGIAAALDVLRRRRLTGVSAS